MSALSIMEAAERAFAPDACHCTRPTWAFVAELLEQTEREIREEVEFEVFLRGEHMLQEQVYANWLALKGREPR
jgi:hypothetical protein